MTTATVMSFCIIDITLQTLTLAKYHLAQLSGFSRNNKNTTLALSEKSLEAYTDATKLANEMIKATHPLRMGLALNFAVYYYEIKKDVKMACSVAEQVI